MNRAQSVTLPELVQHCEKLIAAQNWAEARRLLQLGRKAAHDGGLPPGHAQVRPLERALWRIAPFWWDALENRGIRLRRCQASDADFYKSCYADADFARRYNRQTPWRGNLANALAKTGQQPPLDLGQLQWVVCDVRDAGTERPIGLASLTSLSEQNQRAEFSIGLVDRRRVSAALDASLQVMDFAFFKAGLNKLTSYVYADNPAARDNALHLGFAQEGLLADHFFLPPGRFFDVHALGLTRAQLQANTPICALARRRLGRDWAQPPMARPANS